METVIKIRPVLLLSLNNMAAVLSVSTQTVCWNIELALCIIRACMWYGVLTSSVVFSIFNSELSTECPAGMVMNQCGSLCQESCDQVLLGVGTACPLVCGPPDCVCPVGLVLYRDRCVSPMECYSLELCKTQYIKTVFINNSLCYLDPPELQPLPLVVSQPTMIAA